MNFYPRFPYFLTFLIFGISTASSSSLSSNPTQTTLVIPAGTVVGSVHNNVESFAGIPYAHPPTGPLRLRPPVRLEQQFDTINATGIGPACPQISITNFSPLALQVLSEPGVEATVNLGDALGNESEDCLAISVSRPQGTELDAKLPVLFWIYGGGFEVGSTQPYNASTLIPRAVAQGKPFIFVAVNYRVGGFGFLGGSEILAEGSANLGLLDQRMGLEWVADNIEAFGGDPAAVTIWGESAGSVSVFNQMALYDGNNTYNGRALFRAAIMNSGSILSLDPVDGSKAQQVFDTVVEAAGCSSSNSSMALACLRSVDYATYMNATNSVPPFLSYDSLALNYVPRPDGKTLTANPHILAQSGKYAAVPVIIGDLEDEGTLFSLFQTNITTKAALISYLNDIIFPSATNEQVANLVNTYPYNNGSAGSPFGTGALNQTYQEFKRLAAILGDTSFILARRIFLETIPQSVPAWSYIATWNHLTTPILGTYHTADLPRVFYGVDAASQAMQDRYISFVTSLDPNDGVDNSTAMDYRTYWPSWHENRQLMELGLNSTGLLVDDFRDASFDYLKAHIDELRY